MPAFQIFRLIYSLKYNWNTTIMCWLFAPTRENSYLACLKTTCHWERGKSPCNRSFVLPPTHYNLQHHLPPWSMISPLGHQRWVHFFNSATYFFSRSSRVNIPWGKQSSAFQLILWSFCKVLFCLCLNWWPFIEAETQSGSTASHIYKAMQKLKFYEENRFPIFSGPTS